MVVNNLDRFHVVEKRVAIFSAATLSKLAELGVQISGGSGKIHAHIWIPHGRELEVFELLKNEGFYEAPPHPFKIPEESCDEKI
jgi:hypothetical protein